MAFKQIPQLSHVYVILISSTLIFLSSIICIASKSTASRSYKEVTYGWSVKIFVALKAEFPNETIALATYPDQVGLDATTLVLVTSSIALVISIGLAILSALVTLKHKPIKLLWYQKQALLFILFANASLAFAAFVTNFVLHSKSEHFSLSYRSINGGFGSGDVYDGIFDLETWTCEVKNLPSFQEVATLGQQCAAELSGRACTVIVFLFASVVFITVWWDIKAHQSFIAVTFETDRMAEDDEDDCELDSVAVTRQLGLISFHPEHK